MDNRPPGAIAESSTTPRADSPANARRKRRSVDNTGVRYFLPKPESSADTAELGQEVASEGEALIQAFKSGQPFYTLIAWKAVPEVNGGGSPVIVKQAVARN